MELVRGNFFAVVPRSQSVLCPGTLVHVASNRLPIHLVHEIEIAVEVNDFGEGRKGLPERERRGSGSWRRAKLDGMERSRVHGAIEQGEEDLCVGDVAQSAIHDDEQEAVDFIHIEWLIVDDSLAPVELTVHPFLSAVERAAEESDDTVEEASHSINCWAVHSSRHWLLGHDLPGDWLGVDHSSGGALDGAPLRLSVLPSTDLGLRLSDWNSDVRLHIWLGLSWGLVVTGDWLGAKLTLVAIGLWDWGGLLLHCSSRAS